MKVVKEKDGGVGDGEGEKESREGEVGLSCDGVVYVDVGGTDDEDGDGEKKKQCPEKKVLSKIVRHVDGRCGG